MKYVKLDDNGKKYARDIEYDELPEKAVRGLVAEYEGSPVVTVPDGTPTPVPTAINHETVVVDPDGATEVLTGFVFSPTKAGWYKVSHWARHRVYGAGGAGGYLTTLRCNGVLMDRAFAIPGGTGNPDVVALNSPGRLFYCDGSEDEIVITIEHDYNGDLDYGAAIGLGSEAYTVIVFVGLNPEHGVPA